MNRVEDLRVRVFADGAALQGIADLARLPYIRGLRQIDAVVAGFRIQVEGAHS